MTGSISLNDFISPIFGKSFRKTKSKLFRKKNSLSKFKFGVEQSCEFYDLTLEASDHWKKHYTESHYYSVWTVVADRINNLNPRKVIDIGCGPGQVDSLLKDLGIQEYLGIDFSSLRVRQAQSVYPDYKFISADIFESDILEVENYDCVLAMEFLEHVDNDISVIQRISPGTNVIATVPNFPSPGHVRHFRTDSEVLKRYLPYFMDLSVLPISGNKSGQVYFLLQGVKNDRADSVWV
jgi:SAM-dependent methyltransferase